MEEFLTHSTIEIATNILLAMSIGLWLGFLYQLTKQKILYSQAFIQSIVFVTLIVAIVMMVVGQDLIKVFALVGAMSIIRFRTTLKDPKDLSYIFGAVVLGMAAGTSNYILSIFGVISITVLSSILKFFNFGSVINRKYTLTLTVLKVKDGDYLSVLKKYCNNCKTISIKLNKEEGFLTHSFEVFLKERNKDIFISSLNDLHNIAGILIKTVPE